MAILIKPLFSLVLEIITSRRYNTKDMKFTVGWRVILILIFAAFSTAYGQSDRGKIIKAGAAILDPNGDGFVSQTNAGFSFDGYYVDEFEIKMFGVPQLSGDVTGDNIGNNCGITDLIPDSTGHSVYAVRDVNNNLIFRFRVGDDNPSVEAWTILLDTDGLFGANDPNATAFNPGFEIDITLIKNSNQGVKVYNINGIESCPPELLTYPFSTHFQISIADEVTCGDPDYFYDFYVPFSQIANAFGIDENTGLRYAAVTNVSATCAMAGKIADISGVDYNDYKDDVPGAFIDIISNQCPTPIVNLCETCVGFTNDVVSAPTIDTPVRAGQEIVSGTSDPDIYITVEIYSRIGGTDAAPIWSTTPRETKAGYANGTVWSVTLDAPLQSYDKIVAKAQLTETSVPCGADGDNTASTSVTVVQPNTKPTALNQTLTTQEDTPITFTLTGTDPENDPLTFFTVTNPTNGTLSGTVPTLTFTPDANFNGTASFTFNVSDGIYTADVAGIITINVTAVNDVPVANNQTITVVEDTPKSVTLTGSDIDGDALTFIIQTQPQHGTLSGTGADLTYSPALNYNGPDNFTFVVDDGTVNSSAATVTITVTPVNDSPVANDQSISVTEDTPKPITLTATDADGNALIYTIVTPPTQGTLSGSGANRTYTPNLNYNGGDSFTFKVNDGTTDSNIATVTITVTDVNDAPVASSQNVSTDEDTPVIITLTGTDVDGNTISYSIQTQPLHGTLSGSGASRTYTPDLNYNGADNFTFVVNDGTVNSNVATVNITVLSVNDAPVANAQAVSTDEDVSKLITLTGSDPDGNTLTYILVSGPANGTLTGSGANRTYTPTLNFNGADNFTFKVNDGTTDSNIATVSITVNAVNDPPIANNQTVPFDLNTPKAFTLIASDPDVGDVLAYILITSPANGSISGTAPNLTFTPDSGFIGSTSFTFKVNDGTTDSNIATVSLVLDIAGNEAPIAEDQGVTTDEDVPKPITLGASDNDGDELTYTITQAPAHGTITGTYPNITYSPELNYFGTDIIQFKANDLIVDSNIGTITITINPINDVPEADDQSVSTQEDTPKNIVLTGSDIEGDILTFIIVTQPVNGTLSGPGPNQIYSPSDGFFGSDSFTFKVNDGTDDSNDATVNITVSSVNDSPVAVDDVITTDEDTPVTLNITTNDFDSDGTVDPSSIDLDPTTPAEDKTKVITGEGTYTVNVNGEITLTPELNYNGIATPISYTIKDNDGALSNAVATISVTVNPINDAPVPQDAIVIIDEDNSTQVCVAVVDVENDPSEITEATSSNGNGTISNGADGALCFNYSPEPDFNGQDIVVVTVCDVNDPTLCNTATITINITPVNDTPIIVVDEQPKSELVLTTNEDTPLDFCYDAIDIDGDITHLEPFTGASPEGTLVEQASGIPNRYCFTFTPTSNFSGQTTWNLSICDDGNLCTALTVIINITPVNDLPVADNQSVTTNEDTAIDITLSASDVDNDDLTYAIVSNTSHGTVILIGATVTYSPAADYFGSDSFTFRANDGAENSNIATVNITVLPINDAPVITPLSLITKEDSVLQVCLGVIDIDGDAVTFNQATNLSGGGEMDPDPNLNFCYLFTPDLNYNGYAIWQMKVCDNEGLCGTSDITLLLNPVNDAPVAMDDNVEAAAAETILIDVLANDRPIEDPYQEFYDIFADRDSVDNLEVIRVESAGSAVSIIDNKVSYTASINYVDKEDTFWYWMKDSGGLVDSAMVYINVGPAKFQIFEALSPNGDGQNDFWRINGIEQDPNNLVRVFDRFNNLVFETKAYTNESNHWTGQSNHGISNAFLPEGTYYYIISIDLTEDSEGERIFSGYMVLKRK